MGKPVTFAGIAGNAGANNVLPCGLPSSIPRQYMVDIKAAAVKDDSAVLTGVPVPLEDVVPGEFDLLFRKPLEEAKHNDTRNPDLQGDGLQHPGFGIRVGKIPPTPKIMRQKITGSICCYDVSMTLVE
jgi:hypothetical protein